MLARRRNTVTLNRGVDVEREVCEAVLQDTKALGRRTPAYKSQFGRCAFLSWFPFPKIHSHLIFMSSSQKMEGRRNTCSNFIITRVPKGTLEPLPGWLPVSHHPGLILLGLSPAACWLVQAATDLAATTQGLPVMVRPLPLKLLG